VVAAPPLSAPPAPPHPPPVVPLAVEEVEAEATSGRRLYERGGTKSAASAATAAAAVTLLDTNACGDALATSQLSHFLRSSPQGVKRMSEDGHHLEQELEKQRSHEVIMGASISFLPLFADSAIAHNFVDVVQRYHFEIICGCTL